MKKVLVITYYWPPAGGPGVQRTLKFVKYLRDFGWEPIVYTVSNGEYPIHDPSLEKEIPKDVKVIRQPIWEPFSLYKRLIGQKQEEKINPGFLKQEGKKQKNLIEDFSVWVRGNFFIPDARKFWIKPSVKYLAQFLKDNPVEAIFTSGPPHSAHMIGLGLKKRLNLPWVSDFRDPWTNIDFYDQLKLSKWADRKHHRLEKEVLDSSSEVLVIGNTMKEEFEALTQTPVTVLHNGYDETDLPLTLKKPDPCFGIVHIGMINKDRNHKIFWKALEELMDEIPSLANDLVLKFIGKADQTVFEDAKAHGLEKFCEKVPYVPHSEIHAEQQKAPILYLPINNTPNAKGILTGKIFEYLAAQRPILCVGPTDGDAAKVIQKAEAGKVVNFEDLDGLKKILRGYYADFKEGNLQLENSRYQEYNRKTLTGKLAEILDKLC